MCIIFLTLVSFIAYICVDFYIWCSYVGLIRHSCLFLIAGGVSIIRTTAFSLGERAVECYFASSVSVSGLLCSKIFVVSIRGFPPILVPLSCRHSR